MTKRALQYGFVAYTFVIWNELHGVMLTTSNSFFCDPEISVLLLALVEKFIYIISYHSNW